MKKLFAFIRKPTLSSKPKGFAYLPMWLHISGFAIGSAWLWWFGPMTLEAFHKFDHIAGIHGIDLMGWLILAMLLLVAASLVYWTILVAASLKVMVDRLLETKKKHLAFAPARKARCVSRKKC